MLERHYKWKEEQSLKRLPFKRCSPMELIDGARRYADFEKRGANPILKEIGRELIREMVFYE